MNPLQKRDADLVSELLDKAMQLETKDRKADYEKAAEWFKKKHGKNWQDFIAQKPRLDYRQK